jgi:capsular polysaccharide biosynthesis protein
VKNGVIPGRIVLESQQVPEFGPETLVKLSHFGQDLFQPWPVFWSLHRNARLVGPSLVHLNAAKEACIEAMYGSRYFKNDSSYNHITLTKAVSLEGNWTSIFCNWCNNEVCAYWHFIMDGLPRLALLHELPSDTRFLVPANLEPWQRELLGLLGLAGRYRETCERHLLVENYYYSSQTAMTGCCNSYAVDFLRKSLLSKANPAYEGPRKFYIIREGWSRGVTNEAELRRYFLQKGWALIAPETLDIPSQIRLFSQAEAVCGIHGSAFTNLLWASPGCRVLELIPEDFLSGAFECVARILNLDHSFLICKCDAQFRITVNLSALETLLNRMA